MKLDYNAHLSYCILGFKDDYSRYTVTLDWTELAPLFEDLLSEGIDDLDKVCIKRVTELFATYFDKHNYIGDKEYDRFVAILNEMKEEME